jgi:uncharacterized protein YlxP (DUF503 family)
MFELIQELNQTVVVSFHSRDNLDFHQAAGIGIVLVERDRIRSQSRGA